MTDDCVAGRADKRAEPAHPPIYILWGRRGLVIKAAGWLSLDRQFEPYPRANTVAPSWCGLGCRSRTLMVEYISPLFSIFLLLCIHGSECGRDRPGFGFRRIWGAVQYYIIFEHLKLKLYNILSYFITFIVLNNNIYNIKTF